MFYGRVLSYSGRDTVGVSTGLWCMVEGVVGGQCQFIISRPPLRYQGASWRMFFILLYLIFILNSIHVVTLWNKLVD